MKKSSVLKIQAICNVLLCQLVEAENNSENITNYLAINIA